MQRKAEIGGCGNQLGDCVEAARAGIEFDLQLQRRHCRAHGTTEQLYLLLRVALAQHLASTEETAPLILDDVTVQSDRERTWAVLDLLHEVSEQRQVVLFTQEDEVLSWAERELREPHDLLVTLPPPRV